MLYPTDKIKLKTEAPWVSGYKEYLRDKASRIYTPLGALSNH